MATALRLLGRRGFFRAELEARLKERGFEAGEIVAALRRCDELGYLDDEKLAVRFVELRAVSRGWGRHRLRLELVKRGAPEEIAARVSHLDPEIERRAMRSALRRIERRARNGWWRLHAGWGRMVSSLVSRGFDTEIAFKAVSELAAEREKGDHARDDQCGDPQDIP